MSPVQLSTPPAGYAIDPARNVQYGASYLRSLRAQTNSWGIATAHYHSRNKGRGEAYRSKVYRWWNEVRKQTSQDRRLAPQQIALSAIVTSTTSTSSSPSPKTTTTTASSATSIAHTSEPIRLISVHTPWPRPTCKCTFQLGFIPSVEILRAD